MKDKGPVTGPNALHSLYGEGHLNAKRTRESVAFPGERDQRICSPWIVVERLHRFFDGKPAYDPSHCEGSIVRAKRVTSTRGLLQFWPDRTYFNPPYGASLYDPENQMADYLIELEIREAQKFARAWNKTGPSERREQFGYKVPPEFAEFFSLEDVDGRIAIPKFPPGLPLKKAGLEDWLSMHIVSADLSTPRREIIGLVPNRTHRPWLRQWRAYCDALVELNPLAFLVEDRETGEWVEAKSAYPAPLVLGYTGPRGKKFCEVFGDLGDPV